MLSKHPHAGDCMEKTVLLIVVVTVVLTGCVGSSASPEEVRDGFAGDGKNVSSYAYEGEITFEISALRGAGTQTQTITTDAVVDYDNREMRAEQVTSQRAQETRTTRYVVNGTAYDRTLRGTNDTGWISFDKPAEVERTWDSMDELGFYTRILENAPVSTASQEQETIDGTETHALRVELDDDERTDFLTGKLRDEPGFLRELRTEEFNSTVWISEDGSRLLRAETEATLINSRTGRPDLRAELSFIDEFSYDEPVEIELPQEAHTNTSSG